MPDLLGSVQGAYGIPSDILKAVWENSVCGPCSAVLLGSQGALAVLRNHQGHTQGAVVLNGNSSTRGHTRGLLHPGISYSPLRSLHCPVSQLCCSGQHSGRSWFLLHDKGKQYS